MKHLKTFEALVGNKFYFSTHLDIEHTDFREARQMLPGTSLHYTWTEDAYLFNIYDHEHLKHYNRFTNNWISPRSNYYYKVTQTLDLFKFDKYHFNKLAKLVPTWMDSMIGYLSLKNNPSLETVIDEVLKYLAIEKGINAYTNLIGSGMAYGTEDGQVEKNLRVFAENWDGLHISFKKGDYVETSRLVYWNVIKSAKIITGNEKRFGIKSNNTDFKIPHDILTELIRYTEDASKKMKLNIKDWLLKNSPKPEKHVPIYRAFAIDVGDWGKHDTEKAIINDPDKLKKYLSKLTGLKNLTDFVRGNTMNVKRGKESSWSHTPQVSRQFARGMASGSINVLVKTVADPKDIVIDFTLLPEEEKKHFQYKNQNEVILDTGSHEAKIMDVWVSSDFEKWLNEHGYSFVKQKGIVKL